MTYGDGDKMAEAGQAQGPALGNRSGKVCAVQHPFMRSYSEMLPEEPAYFLDAGACGTGAAVSAFAGDDARGSAAPESSPLGAALQRLLPRGRGAPHGSDSVPVFVMLPLDTINAEGVFRYASMPWFNAALQLLANSGVHGVAVDVWWSAVERSPRSYNWSGYRQLLEMLRPTGLRLQAVLSFHACGGNVGDLVQVPLPEWVLQAGQYDPDIFFTDRPRQGVGLGQRNKEYISFWADEEPVLFGRTPMQCYEEFMASFADAFSGDLGAIIEEVVVGAGPCGELRFPAYVEANGWRFPGVGEFQCYDRRALASLAAAARARGRPEWGHAGPHDSGEYNSSPHDTGFFAPDGSWGSDYGDFFLTWYSGALYAHGERVLAAASRTLGRFQRPARGWGSSGAGEAADAAGGGRRQQVLQPGSPLGRGAQALLQRIQSVLSGGGGLNMTDTSQPQIGDARTQTTNSSGAGAPLDAQQQSYNNFVASVFSALAGPQQGSAAPLDRWESGGSGGLDNAMARLGLVPPASGAGSAGSGSGRGSCDTDALVSGAPRDSSSSGVSGAGADASAATATGPQQGASRGAAGGCFADSVVSLDSLADGNGLATAGSGGFALGRWGADAPSALARLVPPLESLLGADGRSTSTLTDSIDAASASAAPTPQGGLTPRRGPPSILDASVGSLSPDTPAADAAAALASVAAAATALQQLHPLGAAAYASQQTPLDKFLSGLSGMGADAIQLLSSAAAAAQQAVALGARPFGLGGSSEGLTLTMKLAGVHWWYNSCSHASELTAGYYNTTTRDGYTPLLELCARHSASVTLTCVEMCDAQHPRHAQCGPEGLLRQIRGTAAQLGVPLSGENALRIFLPGGGIDATALDRIVGNTAAWDPSVGGAPGQHGGYTYAGCGTSAGGPGAAAAALRSCSSWPCAPMREQQLVQQQYVYPGQYAAAGGAVSEAVDQSSGNGEGVSSNGGNGSSSSWDSWGPNGGVGNTGTHRSYSEIGASSCQIGTAAVTALAPLNGVDGVATTSVAPPGPAPGFPFLSAPQRRQQQGPVTLGPGSARPPQPSWHPPSTGGSGLRGPPGTGQTSSSIGSYASGVGAPGDAALPAMRAFTFLRLGPEILEHQGPWMRFMYKMRHSST